MDEDLAPHYQHLAIKPWEYALANGLGFCEGCIVKYISRYQYKGEPMRDLLKARACLDVLIKWEQEKRVRDE
jgi:hypothetical protein